ncbi:MAG TPA: hypothetical protein V6D20_25380 [Candidatus Obscuribacterales bacterium]
MTTFNPADLKYLIDIHGQTVTFTRVVKGAYNPSTGTTSGDTTTNYTVKVYFYDYKLAEVDGTNIQMGDRKVVFPLVDTSGNTLPEPQENDKITGIGDGVTIVSHSKIYSSTPVCYLCQVRE